ncbi:hypothetical protein [Phyllobacterium endophyticum]|uniref:hypothetical protein n=1 Tax=Phyllobacterium endophyticum TaxID=1149773 RepID=UPI0017FD2481|nr:DNA-directed RNA polymerase alpha subunit [Phyllobacterium endophyticum]
MATKLADLKLTTGLLIELNQCGYETAQDLAAMRSAEILRLPGDGRGQLSTRLLLLLAGILENGMSTCKGPHLRYVAAAGDPVGGRVQGT